MSGQTSGWTDSMHEHMGSLADECVGKWQVADRRTNANTSKRKEECAGKGTDEKKDF
jgi:hypothetical protein